MNLRGSLAAEVQFRDSYDGGALGNVSIEILPSTTKTIWHQLGSAAVEPGCQLALVAHRCELRPCGDSRRRVGRPAPALAMAGRPSFRAAREFKNEAGVTQLAHVRTVRARFAGGAAGDGSYSARSGTAARCRARTVVCRASRSSTRRSASPRRRTSCRCSRASTRSNNLAYGTGFPAAGDPDEYLGSTPNPFPYPAIDPDPTAGDPTIAGNAGDTVLRTNALSLVDRSGRPAGGPRDRYADRAEHASRPVRVRRTSSSASPVARRTCSATSRARATAST